MNEQTLLVAVTAGFAGASLMLAVAFLLARTGLVALTALALCVASLITVGTLGDLARILGVTRFEAGALGAPLLAGIAVLAVVCLHHAARVHARRRTAGASTMAAGLEDLTDTTELPAVRAVA